jgi:hypothetical protein
VYSAISPESPSASTGWPLAVAVALVIASLAFQVQPIALLRGVFVVGLISILFRWTPLNVVMTPHLYHTQNAVLCAMLLAAGWRASRRVRLFAIVVILGVIALRFVTTRYWEDIRRVGQRSAARFPRESQLASRSNFDLEQTAHRLR